MEERDYWIRLARSVSATLFWKLLYKYRSACDALSSLAGKACTIGALCKEKDQASKAGCVWVLHGDPYYPALLKALPDAPPVLLVRGNIEILKGSIVAMVGARNCSAVGADFAYRSAQMIGQTGTIVVSGMARGIDTAVHRGALATGTVAVLAGGVDQVYPEDNRGLYNEIVARGGAIVSESAMETPPLARFFSSRNRVITGMSSALVVIEAAMKSGSLMTARLAMEYNREVFAVPGHPTDPRSRGGNFLIKNGASMFESHEDLAGEGVAGCWGAEDLGRADVRLDAGLSGTEGYQANPAWYVDAGESVLGVSVPMSADTGDSAALRGPHAPSIPSGSLLGMLSDVPISIDELAVKLGIDVPAARVEIAALELDGEVRVVRDGRVIRTWKSASF